MPRLLHLSGEQDPRRKAKTSSRSRVLLLDAEGAAIGPRESGDTAEATPDSASAVLRHTQVQVSARVRVFLTKCGAVILARAPCGKTRLLGTDKTHEPRKSAI